MDPKVPKFSPSRGLQTGHWRNPGSYSKERTFGPKLSLFFIFVLFATLQNSSCCSAGKNKCSKYRSDECRECCTQVKCQIWHLQRESAECHDKCFYPCWSWLFTEYYSLNNIQSTNCREIRKNDQDRKIKCVIFYHCIYKQNMVMKLNMSELQIFICWIFFCHVYMYKMFTYRHFDSRQY